jgi:Ca2+-binding RTX toxin-like protein
MKLRAALTAALVVPSAVVLTAIAGPAHAVAVCQGQPATIEGSTGVITGTEGNDVIVSTGLDTEVQAEGGNDLICVVGGHVFTGAGDDSVVTSAPAGVVTQAFLVGGNDTYSSVGAGGNDVSADEVSGLHVDLGTGGGFMWLYPTSTPGTGFVDLGPDASWLHAFGESEALVDLPRQTARIDRLLTLTVIGGGNVSATGNKVRITGDGQKNDLSGYGCNIVIKGGDGRDRLAKVGSDGDHDLPPCHHFRSVLKGEDGPDRLTGRNGDDVLLGGRGHDVADGSGGNDRCQVEVARHCER